VLITLINYYGTDNEKKDPSQSIDYSVSCIHIPRYVFIRARGGPREEEMHRIMSVKYVIYNNNIYYKACRYIALLSNDETR